MSPVRPTSGHGKPRSKWRGGNQRSFHRAPPGAPPGTLLAAPGASPAAIRVIAYGPNRHEDREVDDVEALAALLDRDLAGDWPVVWINVDGLGDLEAVRALGERFGLHPLAVEDVVHNHQRAKVERFEGHDFLVARMVKHVGALDSEQVSFFLGQRWLLTFQERPGDVFDAVRRRIAAGQGRIRGMGADYLMYALLDSLIDAYFPVLEAYDDKLEALELEVLANPDEAVVGRLYAIKTDLMVLRRAVWPLREAASSLMRDPSPQISDETRIFLRDCYDHTVQLIDLVESWRELASGLMDLYLSQVSFRMNEVMKVLTIISTVFIPLSFVVGLYGMNFDTSASPWNMPELGWRYGYPVLLLGMATAVAGMLLYFRRKGWMGGRRR